MDLVVEAATIFEHPQIEALRDEYFARVDRPVQRRAPHVRWFVARRGSIVEGCYSTEDFPETAQRWIHDFYFVRTRPRRRGFIAAFAMLEHLRIELARDGLDATFGTDPRNEAWNRLLDRLGSEVITQVRGLPTRGARTLEPT